MRNDLSTEQLQQPINVTLPLGTVLRISETAAPPIYVSAKRVMPAIGATYEGGKYGGISIDNEQLVGLIVLPGDERMPWEESRKWAKSIGGVLPLRIDQIVLLKNLKSEFQDSWYWSDEQCAGNDAYAWIQDFDDGGQSSYREGSHCRARAVRKIPIQ